VLQRMLGHASAAMTLDVYAELRFFDLPPDARDHDCRCVDAIRWIG
jgi:integrase